MELLKILTLLSVITYTFCVDHGNFKTCAQSSFCRRCREMEPNKSPYVLNFPSAQITPNSVHVELWNNEEQVVFNLTLSALVDNTFRLQVEEASPLRDRFRSLYALKSDPVLAQLEMVSRNEDEITIKNGDNAVKLIRSPFRIDFFSDTEFVASVNARGLFKFEHYRKNDQSDPAANDAENADANSEKKITDPGAWEENFKSFRDSKPFGPSAVAMDITFHGASHAYGIPEHADSLALKDTKDKTDPFRHYNLDVFEYELDSPMAIYGAIPLLYAHGPKRTTGVFWNNPSETWIDIKSSSNSENNVMNSIVNFVSGRSSDGEENKDKTVESHFMSESGVIDVFFLLGPNPKDVIREYARLTGVSPIPQYFALGYHQSRWNYNDEDDVMSVSDNFDNSDIPLDVIWLDIEYTDHKKYFTWDPIRFAHPRIMQQNLTSQGRKLVVIIDPHIKRESGYFLHEDALANDYYVKNAEGAVYEGWCWPGSSSYLDFLNPVVMSYYSSLYSLDKFPEATNDMYLWNDMNEPSVFNGPEITMPKDCIHYGNWEHREIHNTYGLLQVKATYDGLIARSKGTKRPFILTRSFFAGSQRYAAMWTGDNSAEWSHLKISIPMCLSVSIAGMPSCGADVGGFFKNPDNELMIRWYQAGAFLPFYRAHSHIDTKRREPYLFPPEVRNLLRDAIRKRYVYLPLWYTLYHEHEISGLPVIRPLFMEYPSDPAVSTIESTYMVGSSLLCSPVTSAGASSVDVYFPGGSDELWYDIDTYKQYKGEGTVTVPVDMAKIPVFQKGGTIIPTKQRYRRSLTLTHDDPYTLIVALDSKGEANGTLYIDDNESFEYQKGKYLYLSFTFKNNVLTARRIDQDATYPANSWIERVIVIGYSKSAPAAASLKIDGKKDIIKLPVTLDETRQHKTLVVKKPAVKMTQTWSITL
ncbi:neutral alpha-glucosidase AB [Chrysoperla carnea]|uniref:neutral alpha-glucosidase AB n=1 Tax=Chrysoperla carnea TaxID=189513 RepID=UPI001D0998E5|nr:neutral alpha-glucosidase AB [Chrysoperla carnea]